MEIKIDTSELQKYGAQLAQQSGLIGAEMTRTMQASVDHLQSEIVGRTPVNTGSLRGSIFTDVRGTPTSLVGKVATTVIYGEPVEYGRKPGRMPPVDVIEMWVRRKGISTGNDSRQVAYMIARSIGKKGTKGAHMFEKGKEAATPVIVSLWNNLVGRILDMLEPKSGV